MNYNFEVMLSLLLEPCSGSAIKNPLIVVPWIYIFCIFSPMVTEINTAVVQMLDLFDAFSLTHC